LRDFVVHHQDSEHKKHGHAAGQGLGRKNDTAGMGEVI
jgi:hypothetical protein